MTACSALRPSAGLAFFLAIVNLTVLIVVHMSAVVAAKQRYALSLSALKPAAVLTASSLKRSFVQETAPSAPAAPARAASRAAAATTWIHGSMGSAAAGVAWAAPTLALKTDDHGVNPAARFGAGQHSSGNPGAPVPIDFVPEYFNFRARVAALDPPPVAADANKTVRTFMEWGWGQKVSETRDYAWGAECNFTRNKIGAKWKTAYPNDYGLPRRFNRGGPPWIPKFENTVLVTHLFVCHLGSEPCNLDRFPNSTCELDSNQTTTVEVQGQLVGQAFERATLRWGADHGACDDLGIVVGQKTSTGAHFVETSQQYNARRY